MATYTATNIKELDITTPTEGATPPSEMNDSVREIKTVLKNQYAVATKTANYTLTAQDSVILANGAITLTLPQQSSVSSTAYVKEYTIVNIGTGTVTLSAYAGDSIFFAGNSSITIYPGKEFTILGNGGTMWMERRRESYSAQVTKTGTYTVVTTDYVLLGDATAASFAFTLPTAVGIKGKTFIFKKADNTANTITITPNGTEKIDGASNFVLTKFHQYVAIQSDNVDWRIVGGEVVQPVIADLTNMQHDHSSAAKGGAIGITTAFATTSADISTTSATYVSTGISMTLSVGPSGIAMIDVTAGLSGTVNGQVSNLRINRDSATAYYQITGKNVVLTGGADLSFNQVHRITGLNPGNHTFLLEWQTNGGTLQCRTTSQPALELMTMTGWSF